ncbi:hypothetical protein QUB80_32975 [Chlorogloeopsis sp. ULAP01]|uniref:hypothetical protein n=1 Tax=Chlorogloeopsis sp. ULAP01 TaxID=3056483 RepID=UPI0025AA74A5|nr:hypothetical protein [Chlorogloeopsis sp. ULAP01]MDM9385470.1 hypothetical protein [Chlorogloeopsis sp. ULAP01]
MRLCRLVATGERVPRHKGASAPLRVKRVVDAQRAASRRVAPGVTWRRVKRVECDWRHLASG